MMPDENVHELAMLLDSIQKRTDLCFDGGSIFDMNITNQVDHPDSETLRKIEALCCDLMITDGGHPDFDNIRKIKEYGYLVFCAERDSFGWLVAGIRKQSGPILYFG